MRLQRPLFLAASVCAVLLHALSPASPMGSGTTQSRGSEAPALEVLRGGERWALRLGAGAPFHETAAEVVDARALELPGAAGRVALWSELRDGRAVPHYAVQLAGRAFSRARETSYVLHTRRGVFDPLAGKPAFSAPPFEAAGELHLVQFVCPPLPAFLDELRARGAEVHHYFPRHARIVRASAALAEELAALSFVRWVGPYRPEYRLEEHLLENLAGPELRPALRYNVQVLERGPAQKALVAGRVEALGGAIEALPGEGFLFQATLSPEQLVAVAQMDEVLWIDRWFPPEADLEHVRAVGGADALETATGFSGEGVSGEVMDFNVRATHLAFQSSPILFHGPHGGDADHGTKTTGCIFGDGAVHPNARGVLPGGRPIFADVDFLADRYTHTAQLMGPPWFALFQSNSWGTGSSLAYTSASMELDDILFRNDLLILHSQGNTGTRFSRPEAWAKNVVSVGAVVHRNTQILTDDDWEGSASIGPAADGRVKPDLCFWYDNTHTTDDDHDSAYTFSFGGTSAATPCTAGYFGLVQEMWSEGVFGNHPSGSTVFERRAKATTARALVINSARSYEFSGTSHDLTRTHTGWGLPDVDELHQRRDQLFVVDEEVLLRPFDVASWQLEVEPGQEALRATLVFLDPPGTTSASLHRNNDLSLRVSSPIGKEYWGNHGLLAGNWSLPFGSPNDVDVVENVFVESPASGTWKVEVFADEVNADGHLETAELDVDFALVVSGVSGPGACADPRTYCSAKPISLGGTPAIGWRGSSSVSSDDFQVTLSGGVPGQPAIVFSGSAPTSGPCSAAPPASRGPWTAPRSSTSTPPVAARGISTFRASPPAAPGTSRSGSAIRPTRAASASGSQRDSKCSSASEARAPLTGELRSSAGGSEVLISAGSAVAAAVMKSTSLALAAFVLPLLVTPGELRIEYVEGRAVTFESEDWTTLEPRVASARLNGQELPAEAAGQLAASFPSERKDARLSWTLVLSQVENGRPLAGRRRYDVLERRVEKGGEERTMEGALVGRTLRLHAKEDAEVEATLVPLEGAPAVDPRHLEDQRLRDLVEVVLPGRAVTLGDHWKLEEEDARILLGQEGAPRLFAEDLEQQAFRELVHEHAGFGAEVRYEADELRDGIACALLVVESRLELEGREVDPVVLGAGGLPAGSRMRGEMALELRLSARVWLALDERRPVARESEIEGLLALDLSIDQPGAALELRIESKMAGEESARWSFSD